MLLGNKKIDRKFYGELKTPEVEDLHQIFHPFACTSTGSVKGPINNDSLWEEYIEYLN